MTVRLANGRQLGASEVTHVRGDIYRFDYDPYVWLAAEDEAELSRLPGYRDEFRGAKLNDGALRFLRVVKRAPFRRCDWIVPLEVVRAPEFSDVMARVVTAGGDWFVMLGGVVVAYIPTDSALDLDLLASDLMKLQVTKAEDRDLTSDERMLFEWLLQHGEAGAHAFLPQLDAARVVRRRGWGSMSIDLRVAGAAPMGSARHEVLADYPWCSPKGNLFGVRVFALDGQLAGVAVRSLDGAEMPSHLPNTADLSLS